MNHNTSISLFPQRIPRSLKNPRCIPLKGGGDTNSGCGDHPENPFSPGLYAHRNWKELRELQHVNMYSKDEKPLQRSVYRYPFEKTLLKPTHLKHTTLWKPTLLKTMRFLVRSPQGEIIDTTLLNQLSPQGEKMTAVSPQKIETVPPHGGRPPQTRRVTKICAWVTCKPLCGH